MKLKGFDVYGWFIGCFLGLFLMVWWAMGGLIQRFFVTGPSIHLGTIFSVDVVRYYLVFLSFLLAVSLLFLGGELSSLGRFMIILRVLFSLLCYTRVHAIWF